MKRVTGIGGIFIKSADPARLRKWYQRHMGIPLESWGGAAFSWAGPHNPDGHGTTVWNLFDAGSNYFEPGRAPFMVNYRVEKLRPLLQALRAEGCQVEDKVDESEFGVFGWVIDPDGNKVELWEPPDGQ
jgi:catechol 2,3-dioxygenase-like lactoylglutathione lyase family enzyme